MAISLEDVEEVRFTVVKGTNPGARIPFAPGARSIRIGRAVDNDIVINDPTVSRTHARVEVREGGCRIADAGSRTGTEKMGFRVGEQPEPLASGDEIRLGDTILRLEVVLKKAAAKRVAREKEEGKRRLPAVEPAQLLGAFQRALSLVGIRTPAMQIVAVAVVAAIAVLVFWPQAPGLPAQRPDVPIPIDYDAAVGFVDGGDRSHLDGVTFELPTDSEGLVVYFKTAAPGGVEVKVGNVRAGRVPGDPAWQDFAVLAIPRAAARKGKPRLFLDHLGYAASEGPIEPAKAKRWAVSRMWVARVSSAAALPARLVEEVRAMRELSDRLEDDVANLHRLLMGLRVAAIGFMKLGGRPAVLMPIARSADRSTLGAALDDARTAAEAGQLAPGLDHLLRALAITEAEIDREYREKMNAVKLLEKRKASADRGRLLALAERAMPEPTDPRNRLIRDEVRRLDGRGRRAYEEAVKAFR